MSENPVESINDNSNDRPNVVEVEHLTVNFGSFTAVKDVSFTVRAGEIFGFLGANGAGKTTTIRVLCGLLRPTEGEVYVAGESPSKHGEQLKAKVGYMSQKFTLYGDMTVNENLTFASRLRRMDPAVFVRRKKQLLDFIAFEPSPDTMVKDLPGGLKQQVSLAAALLHEPEVVFLDEPTAGVTPAARARFWSLIQTIAAEGKTVFVTTHYMDEAEQCGRIALMRSGELIALDSPGHLKKKSFPHGLLEFEPIESLPRSEIAAFAHDPIFSLFEPYGMRYHVEIRDARRWHEVRPRFEEIFRIRSIPPSLEDVFIRQVEGSQR